jgi:hypothetical protein
VDAEVRRHCVAFQKELYSGIPNVAVWRVLRKYLHLKAYKLSIVQAAETNFDCLVSERTIPTDRPQFVDEVSANFCG